MALSAKKSTEKTSASKSLIDLSFSDLTKLDRPQVCKRHRSVSESAYHKDTQLDLICSDLNASSSISCGSSQSELLFSPNYPNRSTAYTNSDGYSDVVDCSDLNAIQQRTGRFVQTTFNKTIKEDSNDKQSSSKDLNVDSEGDETIDEMVSNLVGHLRDSTTNAVRTQKGSQMDIADINSTHILSPSPTSDISVYIDDETKKCDEFLVSEPVQGTFQTVHNTRPPTPFYVRANSQAGIFERDVEPDVTSANGTRVTDGTNGYDEKGLTLCEDTQTQDGPRFPPGFPKEAVAALGNDGDAIMQAAMQWRRLEGIIPLEFSSSSESSGSMCRICHGGDSRECLMHPCKCDGSVRWTHQSCLIKWLAECGVMSCELCGAKYRIRRVGSKNFFRWKPIQLDVNDRLHLILFFFASAFLLVTFSFVVWFSVSHHHIAIHERHNNQSQIVFPIYSCLDAIALAIVCFEGKHTILKLFRRWRAKNMGIMILNREKKSEDKDIEMTTLANDAVEQGTVINLEDNELQMTV